MCLQIPKLQKHKEVPHTTYLEPKEFEKLKEEKVKNRRVAEKTLMSSSKKQFSCANPEKSQKTVNKLDKIRQEEDDKLQFDSHKAKPLPKEIMVSLVLHFILIYQLLHFKKGTVTLSHCCTYVEFIYYL